MVFHLLSHRFRMTYLQRLLHLPSTRQHLPHIFRKPQLPQRLVNMLRRNRLLGLLLSDLVRFGRYKGNEFDAAVYKEVARIAREGDGGF